MTVFAFGYLFVVGFLIGRPLIRRATVLNGESALERAATALVTGWAAIVILGVIIGQMGVSFILPATVGVVAFGLAVWEMFRWRRDGGKFRHPFRLPAWPPPTTYWVVAGMAIMALSLIIAVFQHGIIVGTDPNDHAVCTFFLAKTGSLREPRIHGPRLLHYIDAYPPGYSIITAFVAKSGAGVFAAIQHTPWLIVVVSVPVFYTAVFRWTGNRALAAVSALMLPACPGYLTWFSWSHGLAVLFSLNAVAEMGAYIRLASGVNREPRETMPPGAIRLKWLTGGLSAGAVALTSASQAIKLTVVFGGVVIAVIVWILRARNKVHDTSVDAFESEPAKWRASRIVWRMIGFILIGMTVAALWWLPMLVRYKSYNNLYRAQLQVDYYRKVKRQANFKAPVTKVIGSGDTKLTVWNTVFVPGADWPVSLGVDKSGLNSPVLPRGIGVAGVVALLFSVGMMVTRGRREPWRWCFGAFLLYALAGLFSPYAGLYFFSYRFWIYMALVSAVALADTLVTGRSLLNGLALKTDHPGVVKIVVVGVFIFTILTTMMIPRLNVITKSIGPSGGFRNDIEQRGFARLRRELPPGSRVFPMGGYAHVPAVIAANADVTFWKDAEIKALKSANGAWTWTPKQAADWMRENHYDYLVVSMRAGFLRENMPSGALSPVETWVREAVDKTHRFDIVFVEMPDPVKDKGIIQTPFYVLKRVEP